MTVLWRGVSSTQPRGLVEEDLGGGSLVLLCYQVGHQEVAGGRWLVQGHAQRWGSQDGLGQVRVAGVGLVDEVIEQGARLGPGPLQLGQPHGSPLVPHPHHAPAGGAQHRGLQDPHRPVGQRRVVDEAREDVGVARRLGPHEAMLLGQHRGVAIDVDHGQIGQEGLEGGDPLALGPQVQRGLPGLRDRTFPAGQRHQGEGELVAVQAEAPQIAVHHPAHQVGDERGVVPDVEPEPREQLEGLRRDLERGAVLVAGPVQDRGVHGGRVGDLDLAQQPG